MKILVIEDDQEAASYLIRGLREHGHVADLAATGQDGLFLAAGGEHDVLVVDRMLPGLDGLGLVRAMRETGIKTPVLFLTALGGVGDRVKGLEAGGDDYLVKPFAFAELLARVRSLLRRRQADAPTILRYSDLELDTATREAHRDGRPITLTTKEYELLDLFLRNPRQVLSRDQLLERVWGFNAEVDSHVLEVYVAYLRSKLEAGGGARLIQTVRGVGYILREM